MLLLLQLLSGVALLTFGIYLVKSGVLGVFGSSLNSLIARSMQGALWPMRAMITGFGVTALVQSSNATALILASFLAKGVITLTPALVIMLGADLGSAVMARVLTLDLSWLCPLLLITGISLFLLKKNTVSGRIGSIIIGLGIIILALRTIISTTSPIAQSQTMGLILSSLEGQYTFAAIVGALLAMLCFSSLAAVVIAAMIAQSGMLSMLTAFYVVMGANLGSCILEILGSLNQGTNARRVMTGNFLIKATIALILTAYLNFGVLPEILWPPRDTIIWFHVIFNLAVCLMMLPVTSCYAKMLIRLMPSSAVPVLNGEKSPLYLDDANLDNPSLALSNATREILRLGDFLHEILQLFKESITGKTGHSDRIMDLVASIEYLCPIIKNYITSIDPGESSLKERWNQNLAAVVACIQAADSLKHLQSGISFVNHSQEVSISAHSRSDLTRLTNALNENLAASLNALMTREEGQIEQVLVNKDSFKALSDSFLVRQYNRLSSADYAVDSAAVVMSLIAEMRQLNGCFAAMASSKHVLPDAKNR